MRLDISFAHDVCNISYGDGRPQAAARWAPDADRESVPDSSLASSPAALSATGSGVQPIADLHLSPPPGAASETTLPTSECTLWGAPSNASTGLQAHIDRHTPSAVAQTLGVSQRCPPLLAAKQLWTVQDFAGWRPLRHGLQSSTFACACKCTGAAAALEVFPRALLTRESYVAVRTGIALHLALDHPDVAALWAAFEDADNLVLVTEPTHQSDLYEALQSGHCGLKTEADIVRHCILPCLSALAFLHDHGVVHRGVQLENVLLAADGSAKLGTLHDAVPAGRAQPPCLGTLECMSPEVLSSYVTRVLLVEADATDVDEHPVPLAPYDGKVDVWALGVLAYELLVRRAPFSRDEPQATVAAIFTCDPEIPANLSPAAADWLRRALTKDSCARADARDLLAHPWITSVTCTPPLQLPTTSSARVASIAI